MQHGIIDEDVSMSRFRALQPDVVRTVGMVSPQGKTLYSNEFGAFAKFAKNGTHSYRICPRTGLPVRER